MSLPHGAAGAEPKKRPAGDRDERRQQVAELVAKLAGAVTTGDKLADRAEGQR